MKDAFHFLIVDLVPPFGRALRGLEVRFDPPIGFPEGLEVDDEVLLDLEVGERLDDDLVGPQVADLSAAGEGDPAVDDHAAGPADGFPAAVAEGEGGVLLVADILQRFEDGVLRPGLMAVELETRVLVPLRLETEDLEGQ
ncbi:MAG: hypothetical protein H6P95_2669 [Candidatus Aminicenantes bacterium]|nr:hypothetical protein [Candidatus Aminicenantes bacterium]